MRSIDKINRILLLRGMSGADLLSMIGLSNGVYSQWNTGKTSPSKKTLLKIAEALNVSVDELMDDKDGKQRHTYKVVRKQTGKMLIKSRSPSHEWDGLTNDMVNLISLLPQLTPEEVSVLLSAAKAQVMTHKSQDAL